MNWSKKDEPLWDDHGSWFAWDEDALTVCSTHGRFIPCRKRDESVCRWTQDEGWVDRVSRYQRGELPDWRDT